MNKIFKEGSNIPLTPTEIAAAANAITRNKPFTAEMFDGQNSRIAGNGHGYCNGNCEFVLLPLYDTAVKEGGKRYMVCRKCGASSHL